MGFCSTAGITVQQVPQGCWMGTELRQQPDKVEGGDARGFATTPGRVSADGAEVGSHGWGWFPPPGGVAASFRAHRCCHGVSLLWCPVSPGSCAGRGGGGGRTVGARHPWNKGEGENPKVRMGPPPIKGCGAKPRAGAKHARSYFPVYIPLTQGSGAAFSHEGPPPPSTQTPRDVPLPAPKPPPAPPPTVARATRGLLPPPVGPPPHTHSGGPSPVPPTLRTPLLPPTGDPPTPSALTDTSPPVRSDGAALPRSRRNRRGSRPPSAPGRYGPG